MLEERFNVNIAELFNLKSRDQAFQGVGISSAKPKAEVKLAQDAYHSGRSESPP